MWGPHQRKECTCEAECVAQAANQVRRPVADEGMRRERSARTRLHADVLVVHAANVHACIAIRSVRMSVPSSRVR